MDRKKKKDSNLDKPILEKKAQETSWSESFYIIERDSAPTVQLNNFFEMSLYFDYLPVLQALWADRQSFVTRSISLIDDPKFKGKGNSKEYQFIRENLYRLKLPSLAKKIQKAVLFGLSVQEIVWEFLPDGKIFPKQFIDLPPASFKWKWGEVYWATDNEKTREPLDKRKVFAARYNLLEEDAPKGLIKSLIPTIKSYLKNDKRWENMIDQISGGILVGYLGEGRNSDAMRDEFVKATKALMDGKGSTLGMNVGEKAEILDSSSKGAQSGAYESRDRKLQDNMKIGILGQTLTTESGANSSHAIGKVHEDTKEHFAQNDMIFTQDYLNSLLDIILEVNFPNIQYRPRFAYDSLKVINKAQVERDVLFAEKLGVRFSKKYLEEHYHLPQNEIEIIEPQERPNGKKETRTA